LGVQAELPYTTAELPQADNFDLVLKAAEAVAAGARTHSEIAHALGGYTGRQGIYYRQAAELFGLLERRGPNRIEPTDEGFRVVKMATLDRKLYLGTQLVRLPVIADIVHRLNLASLGLTLEDIHDTVVGLVPNTTPMMIQRRTHTMLAWLRYFGIVTVSEERVRLVGVPREVIFEETLTHSLRRVREFNPLSATHEAETAPGTIEETRLQYLVDTATLEKAMASHEGLVRSMARQVLKLGAEPKSNGLVDLFVEHEGRRVFFEMKSCHQSNLHDQARAGLAQLYEYRYVHEALDAKLVLTLEVRPEKGNAWLLPYLTRDRGLIVCWSDGQKGFAFPEGNGPQDVAGVLSWR
jgi:hypothetical protein